MASLSLFFLVAVLPQLVVSLQVTPNSPCASFCVDSNDLDFSDINSSTTGNDDITCNDSKYATTSAGQKFQRCISCLQDSAFSRGSENDQVWFLYNLRYTFDYCIFGFPNATDIPSTPCATSTACGRLENALKDKLLKPSKPDYSFCVADGSAMMGEFVAKCQSCVAASPDQDFLANYLIALEAGCKQQPPAGEVIGLNETVFSKTPISAIDPNTAAEAEEAKSALSTSQIVGIAVGAIVIIAAVAGIWFVCQRKRRNRRLRLEGDMSLSSSLDPRGDGIGRHRPQSSLSFRCQTHLSPRSPSFPNAPIGGEEQGEKGYHVASTVPLGSHPVVPSAYDSQSPVARSRSTIWQPQIPKPPGLNKPLPLHTITTAGPTVPSNVHYSTSPKAARFSPVDDTPVSTTSTKSTAQLLPMKPYNPAEYASPQLVIGSPAAEGSAFASPVSGSTTSPLLSRVWEQQQGQRGATTSPSWDLPPRTSSANRLVTAGGIVVGNSGAAAGRTKRASKTGSPVESNQINVVFPGPPTRR